MLSGADDAKLPLSILGPIGSADTAVVEVTVAVPEVLRQHSVTV